MSAKYHQRGYQDQEHRESGARRAPKASPHREGPRGRGLGAPTSSAFRCADCGARQDSQKVVQGDLCPTCAEPLHNCVNCRHFDSSARFECKQELKQRLSSKRKSNSCELFATKLIAERAKETPPKESNAAKSAFDALFKGI